MTSTDEDGGKDAAEEGEELAVDKNPSKTDVPYGDETMAEDDEAADQEPIAEAPEKEIGDEVKVTVDDRTTAPQSRYTMRQAAIGGLITVVGLVVVFGLPLLF